MGRHSVNLKDTGLRFHLTQAAIAEMHQSEHGSHKNSESGVRRNGEISAEFLGNKWKKFKIFT